VPRVRHFEAEGRELSYVRHSFATHLLESWDDVRTTQKLLGHRDLRTMMVDTHVLERGAFGVRTPLDAVLAGQSLPKGGIGSVC
jgi:integrase